MTGIAMMPDLSIVIVNWNTRDLLTGCLNAIEGTKDSLDVETIVVDNASTDGSPAMMREKFPHVHLIVNQENVGFARANNQAIEISQGRYVLLLNSDTAVLPGALQELVRFMDKHPEAGAVGSRLLFADGQTQTSHGPFPTPLSEVVNAVGIIDWHSTAPSARQKPADDLAVETGWLLGACILARHEVVQQVGGLDEQFFMYSEEIDWCRRIKDAGWKIYYVPSAQIMHYWRGSSSQNLPAMKAELYRSKFKYLRKHHGRGSELLLRIVVFCTSIPKLMLWTARSLLGKHREKRQIWAGVINASVTGWR
jgi:GT2 family glycosyltransferase